MSDYSDYIGQLARGEKKAEDFLPMLKEWSAEDHKLGAYQIRGAMLAVQALGYDSTELFNLLVMNSEMVEG